MTMTDLNLDGCQWDEELVPSDEVCPFYLNLINGPAKG
jgi:hypothetical protein